MTTAVAQTELKSLEIRTLIIGFILVGIAVAVTSISYLLNMTFVYQWMVWIIGIDIAGAALILWSGSMLSAVLRARIRIAG